MMKWWCDVVHRPLMSGAYAPFWIPDAKERHAMHSSKLIDLRPVHAADLHVLRRWESLPEIAAWMTTAANVIDARESVEQEYDRLLRTPRVKLLAIQTKAGEVVGFLRLNDLDFIARKATLRILIGPDYQRLGYGREALRGLIRFCFRELGLHRLGLVVRADNLHALRLYERLGFVPEGRERDAIWVAGRWVDFIHMGLLATEWREEGD
jgi:RimJ/RimL family protein N-acetyltransferase